MSASVMMPIVFCASFVPWARLNSAPETIWPEAVAAVDRARAAAGRRCGRR